MTLLLITLVPISDISQRGIYTDLMREFQKKGHKVIIISPIERKYKESSSIISSNGVTIIKVRTLNLQKTNFIEKGIGTVLLEYQYKRAIKQFLSNETIDLVLYSTPPITLTSVIRYIKRKHSAKSYLLLKDIFPQNTVDLGMMSSKGVLYNYFRGKERRLYQLSDTIGCMSPANAEYVLKHNPEIPAHRVEVNPNSIELSGDYCTPEEKVAIRAKYQLPADKPIFIYGGNLGKPQGLTFLMEVLAHNQLNSSAYFLIIGTGTEYTRLADWFAINAPTNAKLMSGIDKADYDKLVQACDIGMIFLDRRFTIPNFPSRLLSYLEYRLPVLCATDSNTDIGTIAQTAGFGYSVLHGNLVEMNEVISKFTAMSKGELEEMGEKGYAYLKENYLVKKSYEMIMKSYLKT